MRDVRGLLLLKKLFIFKKKENGRKLNLKMKSCCLQAEIKARVVWLLLQSYFKKKNCK